MRRDPSTGTGFQQRNPPPLSLPFRGGEWPRIGGQVSSGVRSPPKRRTIFKTLSVLVMIMVVRCIRPSWK